MTVCRQCDNQRRKTGHAIGPRVTPRIVPRDFREPLCTPWDISCLACGDLHAVDLIPAEARRVGLQLLAGRRCPRCGGSQIMEPGFLTLGERQDVMPITADELRGPKRHADRRQDGQFVKGEKAS